MIAGLRLIVASLIAALAAARGPLSAAEPIAWATGPKLQKRLTEPIDVYWSDTPLRSAIEGLARARRVAVLIDRRIDPSRELTLSLRGVPLQSALHRIAAELRLGLARVGDVFYLCPASSADRLQSVRTELRDAVRQLPKPVQRKFFARRGIAWPDLAEPRELLERLCGRNGLTIDRLEPLPHDLWAAADLPPLPLVDRLTLIAFQFDLACKIDADGKRLSLSPLPNDSRDAAAQSIPDDGATRHREKQPPAKSPVDLELLRIDRLAVNEQPLGAILNHLAKRLYLQLRIDREAIAAAGASLDQRVSVSVANATLDELLDKLLRDTGLTFRRDGRKIEIVPDE